MGRSYSNADIDQLLLGEGESMTGDMGMFFLKGCLESGISYAAGYPGAPTSNVMDLLGDAQNRVLEKYGIYFEPSINEAAAATKLYLSINEPIRGFVNWKVVGTNVASDVLAHISSSGVKGGAIVLIGEDEECISTTVQMKSHVYAKGFFLPIIDPIASPEHILQITKKAFQLSEACNQPVMMLFRSLSSNMIGTSLVGDNVGPSISINKRKKDFQPDLSRVPIPPDTLIHAKEKYKARKPKAIQFIRENKLNRLDKGKQTSRIGIITHGGVFNSLLTTLTELGLANILGEVAIDLLTLNVIFPLDPEEIKSFLEGKETVLVVEQGEPNFIEQEVKNIAYDLGLPVKIFGKEGNNFQKGYIPQTDALNFDNLLIPIATFLLENVPMNGYGKVVSKIVEAKRKIDEEIAEEILTKWLPRSPSFCTGCPERPVFASLKRAEEELDTRFIRLIDIGCYTMAKLPPFNMSDSCTGMGSALDVGMGMANLYDRPIVVVFGDGTLFHGGFRNIDNAIHNNLNQIYREHGLKRGEANILLFILLNYHTAMTGDQENPMTVYDMAEVLGGSKKNVGINMRGEAVPRVDLSNVFKAHGAKWVKTIPSYNMHEMKETIKKALNEPGLKIIVSDGECMLEKQRTLRRVNAKKLKDGKKVIQPKVQVDPRLCQGCWPCSEYIGCPSETKVKSENPLRKGTIRRMDETCVGCGVCSEVTQTFGLCPSTYNEYYISNPSIIDRLRAKLSYGLISVFRKI
ncbi:MAG: indolepyruvate ferredoxin oxidoreductase subunit alpha [Methanobacteriota archaeon]|nr:MAG: indolepyruvate ferredoxin oxidoreductase subunit alpha [Euryarchaeota archaeon]